MTGPPTPPPSSATEIQDAARTTLPPPQAAPVPELATGVAVAPAQPILEQAPSPSKAQTSYELLFPSIAELARSGSLRDLINVAERGDLSAENDRDHTRLLLVVPLVLAYMILDELLPARYVLSRLPDSLKSLPLTQALSTLHASVFERKYAQIYARVEELHQFVQQPAFPHAVFGQILAGMVSAFAEAFRKRTFSLLARAYTSISLPLAQSYLGLTAEQVVNVAVPNGWEFHETAFILTPPKQSTSSSRRSVTVPSTLSALSLVADSVANLQA